MALPQNRSETALSASSPRWGEGSTLVHALTPRTVSALAAARCNSFVAKHPTHSNWRSRITYCLTNLETTSSTISATFDIKNKPIGDYGMFPLLKATVSLSGASRGRKVYAWKHSIAPYNQTPKTVTFHGVNPGQSKVCLEVTQA